jgi:hypothetical protein
MDNTAINEALRIIDTISLRWSARIDPSHYLGILRGRSQEMVKGFIFRSSFKTIKSSKGAVIVITYFPQMWDGCSYFQVTFSVQKLVLGNNYGNIPHGTDILQVIENELKPVFELLSMHPLPILTATLYRLDMGKNFDVGEESKKDFYLTAASAQTINHHDRFICRNMRNRKTAKTDDQRKMNNGVEFPSKDHTVRLYDKFAECGLKGSEEGVRFEVSARTNKRISKLLGVKKALLRDLKIEPLLKELRGRLSELGLSKKAMVKTELFDQLVILVPCRQRGGLWDHIEARVRYPNEKPSDLAKKMGVTIQTFNKYKRLLASLEIGYIYEGEKKEIPALSIDDEQNIPNSDASVSEVDSNTCDDHEDGGRDDDFDSEEINTNRTTWGDPDFTDSVDELKRWYAKDPDVTVVNAGT